jgi:hypothetical protein
MPSKISTICYIHDSNERLMQEYTVKEITAVSRLDANDVMKIIYLKIKAFILLTRILRLRLKILKRGRDMFKGKICSLRRMVYGEFL